MNHFKTPDQAAAMNANPKTQKYRVSFDKSISHSDEEWDLEGKIGTLVRSFQEAVVLNIDGREVCFMWMDVESL